MNDPLIWFWFGCAVMMLFWVAVFYRQLYLYRAKRLALVNRYRTWLQLKRVMLASSVSVGNSLGLHVKNVERNNHQWEETCKALRKEVETKLERNRSLEHRNKFLERKCKAISAIINTGYDPAPVPMNPTHNCIHCRQLGLRYCISDVLHGKKTPPENQMPPNATATKPRSFEAPTVHPNTCRLCNAMGLPFCVCMRFSEGIKAMTEAEKLKQGGSDAGVKPKEERSSGDR